MDTPVLFLIFNRPRQTRQVFERIREARPPRLYVAADGPRESREGEAQRCAEVRRLATAVDWPCEVHTLFRDQNLGCRVAVSQGITWFFEHEQEGIILEDDCLVSLEFFGFAQQMLERYRDDERVGLISACNFFRGQSSAAADLESVSYGHIWGWASWRRFWSGYDVDLAGWPSQRDAFRIGTNRPHVSHFWRQILDLCHAQRIDTWDYQVNHLLGKNSQVAISPPTHLVENLGFGDDATHTSGQPSRLLNPGCGTLPTNILPSDPWPADTRINLFTEDMIFQIPTPARRAMRRIKQFIKRLVEHT